MIWETVRAQAVQSVSHIVDLNPIGIDGLESACSRCGFAVGATINTCHWWPTVLPVGLPRL
jgi:hypothetical protein